MKGKNLIILAVLAIILVAAAVNTSKHDSTSSSTLIGKPVFPEMVADNVEQIIVSAPEGTAIVARVNDTWVVPERYNYPADFSKIKDYVLKLAEMKIGQVMKLDDKQKTAMKLVSPTTPAAKNPGTLLDLRGKGNAAIASLLIGDARMRKPAGDMPDFGGYPDGHYVSPDSGKNVFLVNAALSELPTNVKNWMDQDLLNVESSEIKEISITGPDRKEIRLERQKDGAGLVVTGLATNEVAVESKITSIESAISYLRLDDVADPEVKAETSGLDKATVFTATTQKEEIYTVKIGKKQDGTDCRYCRIEVALKDAEKKAEPKDDNEKKKAEQVIKERKELEEKIKALNAKLSKWTYLINSQKTEAMTPQRETLSEPKKEENKSEPETKQ